jgi:hypothetical protein
MPSIDLDDFGCGRQSALAVIQGVRQLILGKN